jgi:hypothetical protein
LSTTLYIVHAEQELQVKWHAGAVWGAPQQGAV